jgi:tRNA(Ser,Leu) C12 N-acetylase TAN1
MVEDTFSVEATARPAAPDLDWNLLVTSMEHHQRDVRHALRPLVRLRTSAFRNVLLARVEDPAALLAAVGELVARRPRLGASLGKILPIARTFTVDPERFASQVEEAVAPLLGEVAGRRFHVRIERRGHKGRIDSHAAERVVGEWILARLAEQGSPGRVDFDDPDVVVAVEVVGDVAGVAILPRALRQAHPLVRID